MPLNDFIGFKRCWRLTLGQSNSTAFLWMQWAYWESIIWTYTSNKRLLSFYLDLGVTEIPKRTRKLPSNAWSEVCLFRMHSFNSQHFSICEYDFELQNITITLKYGRICTGYGFNYDVRVGENGEDIGNNEICARVYEEIVASSVNFTCPPALFGDWVSINKSSSNIDQYERLIIFEVQVFSKYSLQLHIINSPRP